MLLEKPIPIGPLKFIRFLLTTWLVFSLPFVLVAYFFGVPGMSLLFLVALANVILNDIEVG